MQLTQDQSCNIRHRKLQPAGCPAAKARRAKTERRTIPGPRAGPQENQSQRALTDLPAPTLAYLKSRGLDKNAQAILSGHPASDDPALFNQLHRLASEDPVKFVQTSLIASSGSLSKAHMDYLQGLQEAINKQDPQAIAANTQVNNAAHTMQQEMKLSGIDLNPEPGQVGRRNI